MASTIKRDFNQSNDQAARASASGANQVSLLDRVKAITPRFSLGIVFFAVVVSLALYATNNSVHFNKLATSSFIILGLLVLKAASEAKK